MDLSLQSTGDYFFTFGAVTWPVTEFETAYGVPTASAWLIAMRRLASFAGGGFWNEYEVALWQVKQFWMLETGEFFGTWKKVSAVAFARTIEPTASV